MIGLLLHLGACALDDARSLLGRGTPDPSEVDQLGAECDALRKERDEARAQREEWKQNAVDAAQRDLGHLIERDDARTLAHEAKLEFSAAREACEQLRGERDELRAAVRRHLAADTLDQAEPAWRALEALLPGEAQVADWRGIAASEQREAAEVRAQLEELRALMRKFLIVREAYMSCEPGARSDYNACLADMRAAVEEVTP